MSIEVQNSNPGPRPPAPGGFSLPAFAKINWSLRVLGRRPDGFHKIETVFQTIALHDSLTFKSRDDGRIALACDRPGIPVDDTNLVVRAARKLRERIGVKVGADIHLEKRIPAPGGLGGGSSDAAVTLWGLCRLWGIEAESDILVGIGRELGADVPFFFTGGTALGTGLGDRIRPLADAAPALLVIVTPNVAISTASAYAALGASPLTKDFPESILTVSPLDGGFAPFPRSDMRNDFEPVMVAAHGEIASARELLLEYGARFARLCGSGASVFGVFADEASQVRAAELIRARTDGRVFVTGTLSRSDHRSALALSPWPAASAV